MHTVKIKEIAVAFIESLAIPFSLLKVEEQDDRIWITLIPQENTSRYIGYRGQNIAAMQTLLTLILWNNGFDRDIFIVFDIDGYKKKNEEKIKDILQKKIEKIESIHEPQIMPFLGPQERRLIHLTVLQEYPEYETESFTDEKGKRILKISKKTVQEELL